jgi:alkanesulfonate monooxygenase SsuD/methylene tetrahydromethanopterin reductase-like flavin-dependent oxidoreductase (luciferase family)
MRGSGASFSFVTNLGSITVFSVEHHFSRDESWMSSCNLYAVAAGARTSRIRLGGMGHAVPALRDFEPFD